MEIKEKKIQAVKKIFDNAIDVTLYYNDTCIKLEHVLNGLEVYQLGGKRLGYFESFDNMLENLVVDGMNVSDIIIIADHIFY